jgi:hypothetical protein
MNTQTNNTLTFRYTSKYAGGRSHVNINTIDYIHGMDLFQAANHYGDDIYPIEGYEDFDNGINDEQGNELMDAEDYAYYQTTKVGRLDFGDVVILSIKLEDISSEQFNNLPDYLKSEYVNISNENISMSQLEQAIEDYGAGFIFDSCNDGSIDEYIY